MLCVYMYMDECVCVFLRVCVCLPALYGGKQVRISRPHMIVTLVLMTTCRVRPGGRRTSAEKGLQCRNWWERFRRR